MSEMTQLVLALGIGAIVSRYTEVARLYAERCGNERMEIIWWGISSFFFTASCIAFFTWVFKAF